jgi:hypothetical protein
MAVCVHLEQKTPESSVMRLTEGKRFIHIHTTEELLDRKVATPV